MSNFVTRNIPNSLTCCNLLSGCIATTFAFSGLQHLALLMIVIGAVFDFFDGMSARLLGVSSPIGKELDSLADEVTFGVAPATMVYTLLFQLQYPEAWGTVYEYMPYVAFLIAAFSALRLAKFNLDERQATSFIGLPTPANALFWGSLVVGAGHHLAHYKFGLYIVLLLIALSCWMLVAEIPLFALKFKHWGWKGNEVKYIFILSCIPILAVLRVSGLAVIITWYVVLSLFSNRHSDKSSVQ